MKALRIAAVLLAAITLLMGCGVSTPSAAKIEVLRQNMAALNIHMIGIKTGWAMDGGSFLYTRDGGKAWHTLTVPGGFPKGAWVDWAFLGQKGWIAAELKGKVYIFAGKGTHWSKLGTITVSTADGSSFPNMGFWDARHGWVTVTNFGMGFNGAVLFKTDNGGRSWHAISSYYPGNPRDMAGSLPGPLLGFATQSVGWAIQGQSPFRPPESLLLVTHDGGRTWSPQQLPVPTAYRAARAEYMSLRFFTRNSGVLFMRYLFPAKSPKHGAFVVYTTSNASKTWTYSTPLRLSMPFGSVVYDFLDSQDGWVIDNGNGLLSQSENMFMSRGMVCGCTWHKISPNMNLQNKFVTGLDFINAEKWWMTGWIHSPNAALTTFLVKSKNGGIT